MPWTGMQWLIGRPDPSEPPKVGRPKRDRKKMRRRKSGH